MTHLRIAVAGLLSMCIVCDAAHATPTLQYSQHHAYAWDSVGGAVETIRYTPDFVVPVPFFVEAIDGDAFANTSAVLSQFGEQTVVSFDMNLKRLGTSASIAYCYEERFLFEVDRPTPYELSGYFDVTDVGLNESGRVDQYIQLIKLSVGYLFSEEKTSKSTHNEQFSVGGRDGDYLNSLRPESNLKGILDPSYRYELRFTYGILVEDDDIDSGANAVANLTLKLGAIPEPSSITICCTLGLIGVILRARKGQGGIKGQSQRGQDSLICSTASVSVNQRGQDSLICSTGSVRLLACQDLLEPMKRAGCIMC
jgi:hypothetical protein